MTLGQSSPLSGIEIPCSKRGLYPYLGRLQWRKATDELKRDNNVFNHIQYQGRKLFRDTDKWWMALLLLLYAQTHGSNIITSSIFKRPIIPGGRLLTLWEHWNPQHKHLAVARKKG